MTIWHFIGFMALAFTIGVTLRGVSKVKGDKLAVASFISIPVFAIVAISALLLPQDEGYSTRELIATIAVVVTGIVTAELNRRSVNKDLAKLEKMKKK